MLFSALILHINALWFWLIHVVTKFSWQVSCLLQAVNCTVINTITLCPLVFAESHASWLLLLHWMICVPPSPKDDLCYQGHRVNTREDIYMSIYRSSLIVRAFIWATTPPPSSHFLIPSSHFLIPRHGHKSLMKVGNFPNSCNHRAVVQLNYGKELLLVYLQW